MNDPPKTDNLLTKSQVSDLLGLSVITIAAWLRAGRLPGIKVGRAWRIRQSDLNAYIASIPLEQPKKPGSGRRGVPRPERRLP